ncbi:hypothetical protein CQW23_29657 [Capsicum baccatum]|uniref:Uncharacterized protein n=1 Tax=Capsicum baccatum TaxID=33114 RepID=A0A2G2VCP0_CAPBA|nr:hypothetical protein CQW23_29657 [Capsicum baccatum]
MTKQIVLRAPSSTSFARRRQPLLSGQDTSSRGGVRKARFAEVAGGTAAECAAVCCCCPCGLVNLLVLAVYKLPAGLCRKVLRRKRRRLIIKKGILEKDEFELSIHPFNDGGGGSGGATTLTEVYSGTSLKSDKDVVALEKEMWSKFHGAGFWRSPSQRSDM